MKVIGIVTRYGKNDYEITLADFSKEDDEKIKEIITPYVDDYDVTCVRDGENLNIKDANIGYWEEQWYCSDKYVATHDFNDIVTLDEIFKRYLQINGTHEGFEEYVNSGFVNGDEIEYTRY